MNIEKHHEDFCKVFKPKYGTIFNINTVQFEPLADRFYEDAKMLNWAFGGWLQSANREGYKLVPTNPTIEMVNAAIGTHEGDAILPYSFYKAMIDESP